MSLTLLQRYYAINRALNAYLVAQGVNCPIIKHGIDPATLKATSKAQTTVYPYMQSFLLNPKPTAWTSQTSGILTTFEYQLSFFTAPQDEFANDATLFTPFEVAKNALSDVNAKVLTVTGYAGAETTLADLLDIKHHYEFEMKSGSPRPAAFMIARMRAVCGYAKAVPEAELSTDIEGAITIGQESP